ncbi:MAG: LacI family DNA-binding transcriptional regulator [Lachnospiraceae bacterium]
MEKNKMIGVLFADKSNSGLTHAYFSGVLDSFKRAAEAKGYDIAFLNSNKQGENRKSYLEQTRENAYAGVVIACIEFEDEEVQELVKSDIPLAVIDEDIDGVINVQSDNVEGLKDLVKYICDMGHSKIAYIIGDDNTVTKARLKGFIDVCKERGISIPADYVKNSYYRDMNRASYYTEELLRMPSPPTCILYSDDYAAIGGINVLHARGYDIPTDISVAGYDGLDILGLYEPRLSTVKQNTTEIGRIAAEELLADIEAGGRQGKRNIVVKTELEKGKTIGRIFS